jgi:uncharacterized protein YdiU (UPF0061 family)
MIKFKNTYTQLPNHFYAKAQAHPVSAPILIAINRSLAKDLGIELSRETDSELANIFTGQTKLEGAANIAMAYAGHQFGHFNPRLGDGRAMLLGEVLNPAQERFDIQLKGSGPTPFSRGGDGKSSIGPVIREYILSEAMYKLGVSTTRALAAVSTGEEVYREEVLPGGVLTRVASSHIRIGTFEYFAGLGDEESLTTLLDYTINRHYNYIDITDSNKVILFLKEVATAQSKLVASWMSIGFIHGVMNTDNMSISGETIDYGPCAFMDHFSHDKVFSFIDRNKRYAYNNQISIAKWNLFRLASTLIMTMGDNQEASIEKTEEAFKDIDKVYNEAYLEVMIKKIGLFNIEENDSTIVKLWLDYLEEEKLDFTNSFRNLSQGIIGLKPTPTLDKFIKLWNMRKENQKQTQAESIELMNDNNPVFIPRNHLVEKAIQEAYTGDYTTFNELNEMMKSPYESNTKFKSFMTPPKQDEVIKNTYCGT